MVTLTSNFDGRDQAHNQCNQFRWRLVDGYSLVNHNSAFFHSTTDCYHPLRVLCCQLVQSYAARSLEFTMLSAREREVMLLVGRGLSNKEIAERLEISNGTVKVHLHHIYRSLGIRSRTMLAVLAVQIRHPRDGYPGGSCGSFASSATTKQF